MKSNNGIFKYYDAIPEELNQLGTQIVDAAYHVHTYLGPGLLEKVYEICFCYELDKRGIQYQRQVTLPIKYKGMTFDEGLRLGYLINFDVPKIGAGIKRIAL
jgi:hypothetical protein